ncbi:DUF2971 domain-containing protein [Phreatobacter sp. HK31-P]
MLLYHYCSNETFASILASGEVWVSDLSLSNDSEEGLWIKRIIRAGLAINQISPDQIDYVERTLDIGIRQIGAAAFCMSEKPDLLTQWRSYASDGCGFSVGFYADYFRKLGELKRDRGDIFNASLSQIIYEKEKQDEKVAQAVQWFADICRNGGARVPVKGILESEESFEARRRQWGRILPVSLIVYLDAFTMKNPSFCDEREWRLISHNMSGDEETRSGFDFRPLRDRIVPFRRIKLEKVDVPSIGTVYLGPKNKTSEDTVRLMLKRNGYENVEVMRSDSTYR